MPGPLRDICFRDMFGILRSQRSMRKEQLRAWLRPSIEADAVQSVLLELLGSTATLIPTEAAPRLGFAVAMLHDVFASDPEIRRWLYLPDRRGRRPIDLICAGRFTELESLLVRLWNSAPPRSRNSSGRIRVVPRTLAFRPPLRAI